MRDFLDRFQQVAEYKQIKITTLERELGASKGVLSRAITNETDIQCKWLRALVEKYPDINANWLLTGKGEMIVSTDGNATGKCLLCTEKDRTIDALKSTISKQDTIIELLSGRK